MYCNVDNPVSQRTLTSPTPPTLPTQQKHEVNHPNQSTSSPPTTPNQPFSPKPTIPPQKPIRQPQLSKMTTKPHPRSNAYGRHPLSRNKRNPTTINIR